MSENIANTTICFLFAKLPHFLDLLPNLWVLVGHVAFFMWRKPSSSLNVINNFRVVTNYCFGWGLTHESFTNFLDLFFLLLRGNNSQKAFPKGYYGDLRVTEIWNRRPPVIGSSSRVLSNYLCAGIASACKGHFTFCIVTPSRSPFLARSQCLS